MPTLFNPAPQHAVTREMGKQEIHLVGQNAAALEIDIFGVCGYERNGQQLHAGLFRSASGLVVVAALAGGDDITPRIGAALAERIYMVA